MHVKNKHVKAETVAYFACRLRPLVHIPPVGLSLILYPVALTLGRRIDFLA
jgi:hypothetical protein